MKIYQIDRRGEDGTLDRCDFEKGTSRKDALRRHLEFEGNVVNFEEATIKTNGTRLVVSFPEESACYYEILAK